MEKHKILIADIKHAKSKLNRLNKNTTKEYGESNDEDSLESYMSDLRNYKTVDKIEIKRLKVNPLIILINISFFVTILFFNSQIKINELQDDEEKLRKIINIVRPTTLPELKPQIEENTPKIEIPKINQTSSHIQSSKTPTVPIKVKQIDKTTKPNVEEKVKVGINKDENDLKEAEGIIYQLIISIFL